MRKQFDLRKTATFDQISQLDEQEKQFPAMAEALAEQRSKLTSDLFNGMRDDIARLEERSDRENASLTKEIETAYQRCQRPETGKAMGIDRGGHGR